MTEPASIRYKNPGAMWPGERSKRWGSTQHINLRDGNKIAVFPTYTQGAAAQFDLWASNYIGLRLSAAVKKWSGNNSAGAYLNFLEKNAGVPADTILTRAFLSGPSGLRMMKAQARWEAGKPYPMTDAQWQDAQNMVFPPPVTGAQTV